MKMPKRHKFMFLFGVLWLLGPIASSVLMDSELNYVPATSSSIVSNGEKFLHKSTSSKHGNLICPRSLYSDFFRGKSVPTIQNDVRKIPEPQRVSSPHHTEHLVDTDKTAADYFSINKPEDEQLQNVAKDHPEHRMETVLQLVPDQEVKELEDRPDDRYIVKAIPKQHVQTEDLPLENQPVKEESPESPSQEKELLLPILEELLLVDGNRTDDQVVEVTSEAPNKTDRDIPSFREWSQKALEEEQKKREEDRRKKDVEREKKKQQNQHAKQHQEPGNVAIPQVNPQQRGVVSPTSTSRQKKNFASPDCGAKVVAANPESQGASNVLTSYRDEYLLNKCSDDSWFVVELCESIKAHKIEIANFELYSSVPYEFKVSLGNSPHKDGNWALFGLFQAKDERIQQEFSQKNGGVYGKYVKVNILSHHGNEHYCPISIFKIYGTPEIELIGEEEEDNDDDENDNSASDTLKSDETSNDPSHMVFKFIKDKMGETLEKIVGVFKPKDQSAGLDMVEALNESSLVGSTYSYDIVCPMCSIEVKRDVYFLLATNFAKMSSVLANKNIRTAILSSGFCQSNGIDISQNVMNVTATAKNTNISNSHYVGHQLVKFYTTLYGTSRILALCNVIAIDQGLGKLVSQSADKSEQAPHVTPKKLTPTPINILNSKSEPSPESHLNFQPSKSSSSISSTLQQGVSKSTETSVTRLTTKSSMSSILSSVEAEDKKAQNLKEELVTDSSVSPEKPEPIVPTPVTSTTSVNPESLSTKAKEPEMKEPPDVVLVPPVDVSHIHADLHGDQINGNGNKNSGNGQQGRESVWQKLSNRIKALERNVSLSSGYLEELSVLYKKQIEDLQISMRQVTESLALSTKQRERDQQQMTQLQSEYANLLGVVTDLTIQMDTLRTWAFIAHIFLLIFEAMFGGLFLMACYRRLKRQQLDLLIPANASLTCVSSAVTQPILVHPNSKKISPLKGSSSTPIKRRSSVENLDLKGDENKENRQIVQSRRLSLDELLNQEYSRHQKSTGFITDINLSKKQRKRLLRRLSLGKDRRNPDLRILTHSSSDNNFEKEDDFGWTPVIRAGSIDRTTPPALETVPTFFNGHLANVPTSNVYGILNNSLHDDPTPTKERLLFYNISNNNEPFSSAKKLKFSPEVEERIGSSMDDPNHLCAPKPHVHRSNTLKRSKSTSPTRSKTQVAKQRDIFKQFNPENVDWMKH